MHLSSPTSSKLWPRLSTSASMRLMVASASSVLPCMSCQRGLSGRLRRTTRMRNASAGPSRNPSRQLYDGERLLSTSSVPSVPRMAPPQ